MIYRPPWYREDLQVSEPRSGRGEGEEGFLFLEYKRSRSGSQRDIIQEPGGVQEDSCTTRGLHASRPEASADFEFQVYVLRILRAHGHAKEKFPFMIPNAIPDDTAVLTHV